MNDTPSTPPNSTPPMGPTSHVDEVTGLLYIEGQLDRAAGRGLVTHLEQCSPCRQLLDALNRESLLLRQALAEEEEPVPARLLTAQPSEGASWGWLTALALAASGSYTLWTAYVQPWMQDLQNSGFGGQFFLTWLMLNGAFWKGWNDMLQFFVLSSLAVLGAVLLFLFRRNLRRFTSFSVILAAPLLLSLALPPAAQAAEFVKTHATYELPAGETHRGDIFVFANRAHIDGTLDGDIFFFGHSLTIDGHVTGDVIAFAGDVRVTGKVDGNLRTFNGSLSLEGAVERNVLSFVGNFESSPRSHVGGSATLFVGTMQLDGPLGRDLAAFVGEGNINASIGGNVWIRQSRESHGQRYGPHMGPSPLRVSSHADIKGSFRYRGPLRPDVSPQAHLASTPQVEIVTERPEYLRSIRYWYNAMIWGMAFLVGLFFISVAPGLVQETSREVARIGAPLGLGLLVFIVLPIAAVIACITVVGLGLGVSALFLWVFLLFFAQVFAAVWLGEAMLGATSGTWPMTGRLALGLLVLRLGALVPVLGGLVRFLSCTLGMGALALVIYRRMQRPAVPPQAATPVPVAPAV